jgi:hypothetical protein
MDLNASIFRKIFEAAGSPETFVTTNFKSPPVAASNLNMYVFSGFL